MYKGGQGIADIKNRRRRGFKEGEEGGGPSFESFKG